MSWYLELLALIAGFLLLALGAGKLVEGAVLLARRWGVSPFVVGLTVVAWGTSVPEAIVSALAALEGHPASSLGNVLGSNVANVGLVLGAAGLVLPRVLTGRGGPWAELWVLLSLALLWILMGDGELSRVDAVWLLLAFAAYNVLLFLGRHGEKVPDEEEPSEQARRRPWVQILLGSAMIFLGARAAMTGATGLADRLGIGDTLLGLTILAVGTSLPELFASLASVLRGHADMSLGNVIGSNVFNTLAVTGLAAGLSPFKGGEQIELALARDFPVCLIFSLALLALPWLAARAKARGSGRMPGMVLLGAYLAYMLVITLWG